MFVKTVKLAGSLADFFHRTPLMWGHDEGDGVAASPPPLCAW